MLLQATALYAAATNGHDVIVAELVAAGANPRIAVANGATPLHMAALNNYKLCVAALLESPLIDVDQTDKESKTALNYAAKNKHGDIVRMLLPFITLKKNSDDNK